MKIKDAYMDEINEQEPPNPFYSDLTEKEIKEYEDFLTMMESYNAERFNSSFE